MDSPGAAWAIILSNPELRDGQIREAARSRRRDRAASGRSTLRHWLDLVVRALASRPKRPMYQDSKPVPVTVLNEYSSWLRMLTIRGWK